MGVSYTIRDRTQIYWLLRQFRNRAMRELAEVNQRRAEKWSQAILHLIKEMWVEERVEREKVA